MTTTAEAAAVAADNKQSDVTQLDLTVTIDSSQLVKFTSDSMNVFNLKKTVRNDSYKATEIWLQQLLKDIKIRETDQSGGYKFLSFVKEVDPMIKEENLRKSWRYAVYDIEGSYRYTAPELGPDYVARNRLYDWFEHFIPIETETGKQIQTMIKSQVFTK